MALDIRLDDNMRRKGVDGILPNASSRCLLPKCELRSVRFTCLLYTVEGQRNLQTKIAGELVCSDALHKTI